MSSSTNEFSREAWEKLALATGKVTLHWSAIHGWIEIMFSYFSGMSDEKAEAVFFEIRNDRLQREMLLKLVKCSIPEDHELVLELETLLRKIGRQSKRRNAVTHLLWQRVEWDEKNGEEKLHLIIRSPHVLREKSWSNDVVDQIVDESNNLAQSLNETEIAIYDLWGRFLEYSAVNRSLITKRNSRE